MTSLWHHFAPPLEHIVERRIPELSLVLRKTFPPPGRREPLLPIVPRST
jgi:hypothetical protein